MLVDTGSSGFRQTLTFGVYPGGDVLNADAGMRYFYVEK